MNYDKVANAQHFLRQFLQSVEELTMEEIDVLGYRLDGFESSSELAVAIVENISDALSV